MHGAMRDAVHLLAAVVIAQAAAAGQSLLAPPTTAPKHLTVSTSTSAPIVAPGSKVSLFIDVTPNPGIHVYAPGAEDYLPIAVTLKPVAGASFDRTTYPKSGTVIVEGKPVPVFQKPFRLVEKVTVARTVKAGTTMTLSGVVDYQACDAMVCFKPATAPVAWILTVK